MVVHVNRSARATASGIAASAETAASGVPRDPWQQLQQRVEECREKFRQRPVTSVSMFAFENELKALADDACRQFLEQELNRLEPDDKKEMPNKVRFQKDTYRINKKSKARIATRFGPIVLRSFYYFWTLATKPQVYEHVSHL